MTEVAVEECPYFDVDGANRTKSAHCGLLQQILETEDREFSSIGRDACEACCRTDFPSPRVYNNVIASLAHARARTIIDRNGVAGCDQQRAEEVRAFALSEIARTTLRPKRRKVGEQLSGLQRSCTKLYSCDVVVCGMSGPDQLIVAIKSVLNQRDVRVTVHVIDDGSWSPEIQQRFDVNELLVVHRVEQQVDPFLTLARLLPDLRSQYVAFQDSLSVSRPGRLKQTIDLLEKQGSEIGISSVVGADGKMQPPVRIDIADGSLFWRTLVMRRTTLIDMQRIQNSCLSGFKAFVKRATGDNRLTSLERRVTVDVSYQIDSADVPVTAGCTTRITVPKHDLSRIAVDVVLPFHNTIDYVHESMKSVLEQNGVDVVVHLIDDASTVDISQLLEHYGRDSRVRIYRNTRNVGPYVSFNNVSRFFETEFVAIQDADDISLPNRLHVATTSLRLSNTDIFGGAIEMFGDDHERTETSVNGQFEGIVRPVKQYRFSRYPTEDRIAYVINGGAVMRVDAVTRLGGFADYGETERNRCGLDSEFYTRAFFAGCRFFVTRDVVLMCRRHAMSSTQNNETGWGTPKRIFSRSRLLERIEIYRQYDFDPRDFGGLDHYSELTQPVPRSMVR